MDAALIILLVIIIKGLSCRDEKHNPDYMSPANTSGIKGVFVFLVIMTHFVGYATPPLSQTYTIFRSHVNQCVVVMFLFYSGFGMMEQIKRKGYNYVRTIPQRFLTLLINFDIAVVLYSLLQLCYGRTFSITTYLLSLTGWDSVGNSNWYIFDMLCLYVVSWICFLPLRKGGRSSLYLSTALMTAGSIALVLAIRALGKEGWWYNTLLTFPLGMLFSLLRPQFDRLLKHKYAYLTACAVVSVAYMFFSNRRGTALSYYTVWTFLFVAGVVLMSMKLQLRSPVLDYAGKHVFSIYILQRIPMFCLNKAGLLTSHPYLSLIISVMVTILMAEIFDTLTGKLTNRIFHRKQA